METKEKVAEAISSSVCEYLTYKEWKRASHWPCRAHRAREYLTYKEWKHNKCDVRAILPEIVVSTLPIRNGNYSTS